MNWQPSTEIPALVDALRNEIDVVRFHAATALADIGPAARPAVPALIHTCTWDDEPAVRVAAAAGVSFSTAHAGATQQAMRTADQNR